MPYFREAFAVLEGDYAALHPRRSDGLVLGVRRRRDAGTIVIVPMRI